MAGSKPANTTRTLALVVGFLALSAALVSAYTTPATSYEVSIYAATPTAFWVGIAVALAASLAVALSASRRSHAALGLLLGGQATAAVVALPLLRSYHFYGAGDAMTHLGWVKDLGSGALSPLELFYPGIHLVARFVAELAGFSPERSLLVAVFLVSVLVLVFVPLTVRAIGGSDDAVVLGTFAAFLLLPVNTISTHLHAHPFTQTTLFTALILYLFVRYVRQPTPQRGSLAAFDPTVIGALLAMAVAAAVLYHPQQAANVLVVFVAVSVVQFAYRRLAPDHAIAHHRPMYAQTAFLGVIFLAWSGRFETLAVAATGITRTVVGYVVGNPPEAAASVQTQGASLSAIGASLPEIFLKLFFVSAVFALLAGVLVLASLLGRLDDARAEQNAIITYLGVGLIAVTPVFGVYLLGSISEQYFRHAGFMMLPATILAAIALARWVPPDVDRHRLRTAALASVFAVMLALSLVTVFPSPFTYNPTEHVTEQQMAGYETAFAYDDETSLLSVRDNLVRYSDGIRGVEGDRIYGDNLDDGGLGDLTGAVDGPSTVVVSEYDRDREVTAYRELRFSERDFDSLASSPGVSRVHTNGDVNIYHVQPANETATSARAG